MKRILSTLCIFAALFASCTNDELPEASVGTNDNTNLVPMEFSVSGETNRTTLQSDKSVHWESTDVISILDGTNNNEFTTTDSGASATFRGEAAEVETYYAVYPYNAKNALVDDNITLRFPHEQQASEADAPSIHNILIGKSDASKNLVMKNVGGLVYFSMNSSNITSVTLRGNNQEWIAGDATITLDGMGVPTIAQSVTNEDTPTYIYDKITLTPEGETFTSGKTYYIAVPAGVTFSGGINLTFTNTDGLSATLTGSNPLTIGRSQTHNLKAIDTESLNWELQIPLEFIFYNYNGGDVKYNNPFTGSATVGEKSVLTTTVGGFDFYVYGAAIASIKSKYGQGYQVGKSADDYFEFPCPEGWSLYKVVIENGAYSGGTKGDISLVDNNGTQVGDTFAATTTQGKRFTWEIDTPTETVYQLKHGDEQQLTMRKLYLYYQKTVEVKNTIAVSVDFFGENMDAVNSFVVKTPDGPVDITYDGYTYTLYTPASAGFTRREGTTTVDDVKIPISMGLYFNSTNNDFSDYAYFGFPVIEGYHITALNAKIARLSKAADDGSRGIDYEISEIGVAAEDAIFSGSTPGAATYDTVEIAFEEGSTSSDKQYCIRSKHSKTTLTSFTITYTED